MRVTRSFHAILVVILAVFPWHISEAQTVTIDFASVSLPAGGCTDASPYLATFGITFVPVSSGASAQICNATGSSIFPTSSPNFFFIGPSVTNTDVSGDLVFATAVTQITIGTTAVSPVTSVPAWDATVYNASNNLLNSVSQPSLYPGPGALSFSLNGPGITRLHFDAFNSSARTFNAPPIDHITVTSTSSQLATTTTSLLSGSVGSPYSKSLTATGGTPPYAWSLASGSLPDGLILDVNTGAITGTPTTAGAFNFTVQVMDSVGNTAPSGALYILIGCNVSVPPISQSGGTWGGLPYDHRAPLTIGSRGCGLTSLNMALNFAGPAASSTYTNWNPGALNALLDGGGYDPQGNVDWDPATVLSREGTALKFDVLDGYVNSISDLAGAEQAVENELCAAIPHPVIVSVRSPTTNLYPGHHFVLITGEIVNQDGTKAFSINDPANSKTIIGTDSSTGNTGYTNGGQPEFETRGIVNDPLDLSGLSVTVDAIANLLVKDPNGNETGFYPTTSTQVQQIPHSAAGIDAIDDDVIDATGNPVQNVTVNSPTSGSFQILLMGTSAGAFTLSVSAVASDGTVQTSSFPGVANVGSTATYELQYNPSPGSSSTVTLIATFQSTLADISNSLALELIERHLADSLERRIERASVAASSGHGACAAKILKKFVSRVNRERSDEIARIAQEVLVGDANSLLSQLPTDGKEHGECEDDDN